MGLLELSDEILIQILADDNSLSSEKMVSQAMLTCRRLNAIATTVLYSRVICDIPDERFEWYSRDTFKDWVQRYTEHPERAIIPTWAMFIYPHNRPDIWDHMSSIMPKLSSLRILHLQQGHASADYPMRAFNFGTMGYPNVEAAVFDEERNFIRLLSSCPDLKNLRTVHLEARFITVNEILAFLELPSLEFLNVKQFRGGIITDPAPHKRCKLRRLDVTAAVLPVGAAANYLFLRLPQLKCLSWFMKCHPADLGPIEPFSTPFGITTALLPCQHTLMELHLIFRPGFERMEPPRINFINFTVLTTLEISSNILFTTPFQFGNPDDHYREDLVTRLPGSLVNLEIVFFVPRTVACPSETKCYDWIIPLAQVKESNFPGLARVCLKEDIKYGRFHQISWQTPDTIREAFCKARVELDVTLRVESE